MICSIFSLNLLFTFNFFTWNYLKILTILIADILEDAELGNFPEGDNKLACYFKCVMDKGGVVKQIFYKI